VIQGIKICSKIKVLEIARKWIHGVDLVLTNPTQLEWDQTDIVCEIYHVLSDCADRTVDVTWDRT